VNPRVRFEDEADTEYRLAGRYYEARRDHLGIEFFDAVDATIDRTLELPEAGALVPRIPADLPVRCRAVTRFPYHVIYLETGTEIRILAVAHDRRKPGYWKDRFTYSR
jgi:plasmid stabilization system protein ParE